MPVGTSPSLVATIPTTDEPDRVCVPRAYEVECFALQRARASPCRGVAIHWYRIEGPEAR